MVEPIDYVTINHCPLILCMQAKALLLMMMGPSCISTALVVALLI